MFVAQQRLLPARWPATGQESRELYFLAGAASGMLAEITENLGHRSLAMSHARTGFLCAREAGHSGLMAWIRAEQSLIAYHDGRPAQAVTYARRGREEHAPTGTVNVWLAASEARAAGTLGDVAAGRAALDHTERARERVVLSDLDDIGGILHFSEAKQHHYGADSCLAIDDGTAVIAEAGASVAAYHSGPANQRAYDVEASTGVSLASAHVVDGDIDATRDAVQPVFDIHPELRIDTLDQRLRGLHARLTAPEVRDAPVAVRLRDQIEDFLASNPETLPPA